MNKHIKVLIADDHPIFRHGLSVLIQSNKELELTDEVENGQLALEKVKANPPDIIVLDLDMPILDGVETAKILHQCHPEIKVIFLTMYKDRELLVMLKPLNIKGYVLKDSALVEIVDCIKTVNDGKTYISPAATDLLLDQVSMENHTGSNLNLLSLLTPTENRILRLIVNSKTNREISQELFISIRTVENHRFHICHKLKIKGNHSLLKFALNNKQLILSKTSI